MNSTIIVFSLFAAILSSATVSKKTGGSPPHIVVIVIDDLGWHDAPWNNPDSLAVNLGVHARQGVVLDRHYVHAKCSPSRAALLTGRFAWRMGRQRGAIERYQPTGLSTKYPLLSERLKEAGYATHAVGKWHLGYCNEKYLPTRRGFDTFFGIYQQSVNYRNRDIACASYKFRNSMIGYDLRRNENVTTDYKNVYSPIMYSEEARSIINEHPAEKPLFLYVPFMALHTPFVGRPPTKNRAISGKGRSGLDLIRAIDKKSRKRMRKNKKNKNKKKNSASSESKYDDYEFSDDSSEVDDFDPDEGFRHDSDTRDILLATVDQSIHKIIRELKRKGLYENSVILVTTDNGGGAAFSNTPLKGSKETVYEGGIRGAAFLLSPLLSNPGTTYKGLLHLADWYPTFLGLAGLAAEHDIDGTDQWPAINGFRGANPRESILHNVDVNEERGTFQACMFDGRYKLIWGQSYLLKRSQPHLRYSEQLYDVIRDPSETNNIAQQKPRVVEQLKRNIMAAKNTTYVEADYPEGTKRGWPSNFQGFISPGWC